MKTILHEDGFSLITHDAATNLIRIDWRPATAGMSLEDFKGALTILVDATVAHASKAVLADLREFRYAAAQEIEPWRMRNTVPKYNGVVERYAWLMSPEAPRLPGDGKTHQNEGEAYHRRCFRDEGEALSWATFGVAL